MQIGNIGIGTSNIASLGRSLSINEATRLFSLANELGVRLIDTANTYGSGDSERLIAKSINNGMKNKFFIITKAGFPYSNLPPWTSPLNQIAKKTIQRTGKQKNFSGIYLEKCLSQSLKRLKREAVGAFVLHEPVNGDNVKDETWRSLERIKKTGMAELVGISSSAPDIIKTGISNTRIDIVETPVSFNAVNYKEIISVCSRMAISVVANQIFLPMDFLTQERERRAALLIAEFGYSNLSVRDVLISYVQSLNGVASILFGTTNLHHLKANVEAAGRRLSNEFYFRIEKIFNT